MKKTFSLDEEVVKKVKKYSAALGSTESGFISMLVNQVDKVAAEVVLSTRSASVQAKESEK